MQEHAAALFVGAALAAREMIRGALYTVLHALEDPFDDSYPESIFCLSEIFSGVP